jgi:hypothetical protein
VERREESRLLVACLGEATGSESENGSASVSG